MKTAIMKSVWLLSYAGHFAILVARDLLMLVKLRGGFFS